MGILLAGWSDRFLLEAAKRAVEAGAPISHISLVTGPTYKSLPGEYGPFFAERGIVFLDELDYYRREHIRALDEGSRPPLSAGLLKDLAQCENLYMASTDRLSFTPISVAERRRLYYILVQYWIRFLPASGIRTVIFSSTPHMGWDIVLYHVARRLGLRVRYFNRTLIRERVLFQAELDSLEKVPAGFLAGAGREDLIAAVGEPLHSDSRDDSAWAKYSRDINAKMGKGVRLDWKALAWMALKFRADVMNSSFFYDRSVRTFGQLIPGYFRYWRDQKALHRLYHAGASAPEAGRRYAFLALHFQPERSTHPEGGAFEDQLLAVEILSAALPPGWLLYVKEHPRQFSLRFQSRHGRNEAYYRHLRAMPKVRLMDIREDTGRLAQGAGFVATVTGSIGWESIQMGKACMAFGNPWYGPCHSCYLIRSVEDCREAVAAILAKPPEQVELDRLRFLAWIRDRLVFTSTSHEMAGKSKTDYGTLAANLARALAEESAPAGEDLPAASFEAARPGR